MHAIQCYASISIHCIKNLLLPMPYMISYRDTLSLSISPHCHHSIECDFIPTIRIYTLSPIRNPMITALFGQSTVESKKKRIENEKVFKSHTSICYLNYDNTVRDKKK